MINRILVLLCLMIPVAGLIYPDSSGVQPMVVKGEMDLSGWRFEQDGTIPLNGMWEFYWKQLLTPDDFKSRGRPSSFQWVAVPDAWNDVEVDGEAIGSDGFATYRTTIKLGEQLETLALKLLTVSTAYRLWINGDLLLTGGHVTDNAEEAHPQTRPAVVTFRPQGSELDIVLQVSNYHHRKGGAWRVMELGTTDQILQKRIVYFAAEMMLFGLILMTAIYHLLIYVLRRKDPIPLYFALICLLVVIRIPLTGEMILLYLWPDFPWSLQNRLILVCFYMALPVFYLYFNKLYPREFSNRLITITLSLAGFFTAVTIVTPVSIGWWLVVYYEILTIAAGFNALILLILASRRQREGVHVILICFVFLLLTVVNDVLYANELAKTADLAPIGLMIFILAQIYILSRRSSQAYLTAAQQASKLARINDTLEETVKLRTMDLRKAEEKSRSLLESSPDRIYAVGEDYKLLYSNQESERTREQAPFQNITIFELFPKSAESKLLDAFNKALEGGPVQLFEIVENGYSPTRWYECRVTSVEDEEALGKTVMMIVTDITARRQNELELKSMQKDLIEMAHKAGMADIAVDVLHNIGNSLNTLKLSVETAIDLNRNSEGLRGLQKANELHGNEQVMAALIKDEAKLQALLQYHHHLESSISKENEMINENLTRANQSVDDISTTLTAQQKVIGNSYLQVMVDISDTIEEALSIHSSSIVKNNILLERDFNCHTPIYLKKYRLLYILTSLIHNAVESLVRARPEMPLLRISTQCDSDDVWITLFDNGIGIEAENMKKIFYRGYTTKQEGAGYSLHNCANYIAEMGGDITAESKGECQGALFRLKLPLKKSEQLSPAADENDAGKRIASIAKN